MRATGAAFLAFAVGLAVAAGAGFGSDGSGQATPANAARAAAAADAKLDCGSTVRGSKRALRSFLRILARGREARILSVLAKPRRFEWIYVGRGRNRNPVIHVRHDRREAAAKVAERGGLPLRITRFMNAEEPRLNTDFGFEAEWNGRRGAVGKAVLDCRVGKARVLSVGLERR